MSAPEAHCSSPDQKDVSGLFILFHPSFGIWSASFWLYIEPSTTLLTRKAFKFSFNDPYSIKSKISRTLIIKKIQNAPASA